MNGESFIADHVKTIGSSGIRRVFDLSASLKNPINFSIGEPDFDVPVNIQQAVIRAIESGHNGYTVTRGLPQLRDRIAKQLNEEFDWQPDLFVTSGVSGGLYLTLLACINPGDEVLIGDPYFVSYKHLVNLVGGVPVMVDMYDDFQLHPDRFVKAITNKTKMVLISSPGNPTGVVHHDEDVQQIARLAQKHDLLIITDEIYNLISYDGPSPSTVRFAPERTILLRGYSKSYAMTGLRLGFAAGPTEIITEMAKLQQYTFVCAPHPAQYGALEAMDTDVSDLVSIYAKKRDLVCDLLEDAFDFIRPGGGFYLFPKVPESYESATLFIEKAIENNVLIIPGEVFSERDTHFRISYATDDDTIREGCDILRSLAR